jgi:hypothetical protein
MYPNFVKLNLNISEFYKDPLQTEFATEYTTHWQKYTVALFNKKEFYCSSIVKNWILGEPKNKILSTIPKSLLEIEIPEIIVNTIDPTKADKHAMLGPHKDKVRKCAVNFYVNPEGEVTKFYRYEPKKVIEIDSFVAKKDECWILNTEIPHSVDLKPNHIRKIVSFSFINTPFDEVIKHFSDTITSNEL